MAKSDIPNPDTSLAEDSFQTAVQQQGDSAWPIPGDEGYVHPDGTPMAAQQMENNRRAAADRAAAGSILHGAPAATPGPQLQDQAAAAAARAAASSRVTPQEAREGHTEFVRDGLKQAEDNASETSETSTSTTEPQDPKADPAKRTATTTGGKTTR